MNTKSQDFADIFAKIEKTMSNLDDWVYRYQNLPDKEDLPLKNENRASVLKGEIAQLDETLCWLESVMSELDTAHEQYLCDENSVCFRHRDNRSVENTDMMFGPHNPCLEDWLSVLRNDLLDCRDELSIELSKTEKGDIGEDNVFRELHSRYPTLSNIVLDIADEGGATNETDFYVILPHGVAVIEAKNYGKSGQRIWVKDAPHWEITTSQGRHLSDKGNPFYQNKRHIEATQKVLKGLLDKEIPLFSVVVLGNNQVQIMNDTDLVVTNPRGLCSRLDDLTSSITLTEQEQGIIMRHLQSLDIGSRSFRCPSYRKRIEHIYQLAKEIFPVLITNKDIRTRHYTGKKKKNDRLAAILISIPVIAVIIFRNISAGITCLLFMCLIISAVAVVTPILRQFFPKLGMPKRDNLVREVCQGQKQIADTADSDSREARVAEFNHYLLTGAEHYPINFDTSIQMLPQITPPSRYIPFETLKNDISQTREWATAYVKEHFGFDEFDIICLDELWRLTSSKLTLGFQMIHHMCNLNVATFVGLNEAEQYYETFFKRARDAGSFLNINVLQYESGPKVPVEALPRLEELGFNDPIWCRNSDNDIQSRYGDELFYAKNALIVLAECHRYALYLLDLGCLYYEHCGVVVNDNGEIFEVSDWNKTLDHFIKLIENYQDYWEIASADFLKAVV